MAVVQSFGPASLDFPPSIGVHHRVPQDAVEPDGEPFSVVDVRRGSKRAEKRLLEDVLCEIRVGYTASHESEVLRACSAESFRNRCASRVFVHGHCAWPRPFTVETNRVLEQRLLESLPHMQDAVHAGLPVPRFVTVEDVLARIGRPELNLAALTGFERHVHRGFGTVRAVATGG